MGLVTSHARFMIAYPATPATRVVDTWTRSLKEEATTIYQKILSRIANDVDFQKRLAQPASDGFRPFVSAGFVSKSGVCDDQIKANHEANLKRSYEKYTKKLEYLFETVDGIEAKRFKDVVDKMKSTYASGMANRTLPLTGTKIEGLGPVPMATRWLVGDNKVLDDLRPGDKVYDGGPMLICTKLAAPAFKPALNGRLIQAGATIIKANLNPDTILKENDRTNEIVKGFIDPYLNIEAFSTTGDSHVNYILDNKHLFLDVQVAVTP